ncbi:hypothetical protein [Pseudoalteromonas aurantia]|uniref:Uncharacterized protein n=1 Tax=Pseudoalteromonas aurantia 208 TaxID=1314867 RepID=A0ABR9EEW9_9GAMM|nr:hypothetical protein [Pseudoalteromonas aurantia]MBE0369522.1 hypothetical protein [Pseudoalteromonas aurantia 208]
MIKQSVIVIFIVLTAIGCSAQFGTSVTNGTVSCEQAHANCANYCRDDTSIPGAQQNSCLDKCFEALNRCRVSPNDPNSQPTPSMGW